MRINTNRWCDHRDDLSFGNPARMYVIRGYRGHTLCAAKCPKCGRVRLVNLKYPLPRNIREFK